MTQPPRDSVAANVRAEMARANLSGRALADRLPAMKARTLHRRLRGDGMFRIDELTAIAAALDVPISSLIGEAAAA